MNRYFLLCGYFFLFFDLVNSEIRFAWEVFRHGHRSPYSGLDKDNVDVYKQKWSGASELTLIGMRQHYLLGVRNRKRYEKLLSPTFDPKEIYIVSTDTNRTLMSAYSQLHGLYPAGFIQDLSPKQTEIAIPPVNVTYYEKEKNQLGFAVLPHQIQALPIHIFDYQDHTIQLHDPKNCPGVGPYVHENKNRPEIRNYMDKIVTLYGDKLIKIMNRPDKTFLTDYAELYSVMDCFITDYIDQRDLSILTNEGINLEEFYKEALEFMMLDYLVTNYGFNDTIGIVAMSPTMDKVLNWMQTKIDSDVKGKNVAAYREPKFVMYSAHDTTLAGLEVFMRAAFGNKPDYAPFAANAFLELHRSADQSDKLTENDFKVLYIYNDKIKFEKPYPEFRDRVKALMWDGKRIEEFCLFPKKDLKCPFNYFIISTIIFGVISAALAICVGHICLNKRSDKLSVTPIYTKV